MNMTCYARMEGAMRSAAAQGKLCEHDLAPRTVLLDLDGGANHIMRHISNKQLAILISILSQSAAMALH
jgi:hypothetical protein